MLEKWSGEPTSSLLSSSLLELPGIGSSFPRRRVPVSRMWMVSSSHTGEQDSLVLEEARREVGLVDLTLSLKTEKSGFQDHIDKVSQS